MEWRFWIDVGGTFTDGVGVSPDGVWTRGKVLSSGVVKGIAAAAPDGATSGGRLFDPARRDDPAGFWDGCPIRLLDSDGNVAAENVVATLIPENAELVPRSGSWISAAFPQGVPAGTRYELAPPWEAPVLLVRKMLRLAAGERMPKAQIRLGTTRGTNALLTRQGARTAFVVTKGFADVLHIGYQNRPDLFSQDIVKPAPLFSDVLEVDERLAADGAVLQAPDEAVVKAGLAALKAQGVQSLAVCFLHGGQHPQHERQVAGWAREVGFRDARGEICVSHQTAAVGKIVARGDTTVVDAYLTPVLREYVARLAEQFEADPADLRLMTSAGSLVAAESFRGCDGILSGPAGGAVGCSRIAKAAGFTKVVGFDMGGTSTDVSRFDGEPTFDYEVERAGVRLAIPTLAVRTVAAGGGSVCGFDGVKFTVGPQSAGADPGPACYGRGGPLTVTDVNLFLGKILPEKFPFPLDHAAVVRRLEELRAAAAGALGRETSLVELAEGLVRVADENMVRPIRGVSVAQGADPREYLLVPFGGAAGQHACAVARALQMDRILLHPDAGVLSALGMGLADVARRREEGIYLPLDAPGLQEIISRTFERLESAARDELAEERIAAARIDVRRKIDLRYIGQEAALTLEVPAGATLETLAAAYHDEHHRRYGFRRPGRAIEAVVARVEAVGRGDPLPAPPPVAAKRERVGAAFRTVHFGGRSWNAPVFGREELLPGDFFTGPALVWEPVATTVVEPGWKAEVLSGGELLLSWTGEAESKGSKSLPKDVRVDREARRPVQADPVLLEIFHHRFAGIAERMGETLRNTSSSVNVKERLDFSCALFSARGELVVNAPHIPVHLGAMGWTVKRLLHFHPNPAPGDVYLSNDPYEGGSHLPDLTVVSPVHDQATGELLFFAANRAHHAEIGGISPGSMPPFSRRLSEEGVLVKRFLKVVDGGESRLEAFHKLLTNGPYPSRAPQDNLADLEAQIAANRRGAEELLQLVAADGWPRVRDYMQFIQDGAATKLHAAIAKLDLPPEGRSFRDHLDDGTPIEVLLRREGERLVVDFAGTGPVSAGNLNANRAITTAAVTYVLRLLIQEDVPLNEGVLRWIDLRIPENCLLDPLPGKTPEESPAMVGGNVETSQRIVDVLLGAFGLAAASQGTMNNLTFGDGTFGNYETICGGAGATPRAAGADAVHTHMTNTRLTDPEVLERRYPVRVRRFAIRRGSGGAGLHRGGDGVERVLEFLRPVTVAMLTQRRGAYAPYGLAGGSSGSLGRNELLTSDGAFLEDLGGSFQRNLPAGSVLRILTPGGGGFSSPPHAAPM